jgi:hypothetical protein
LVLPEHESSIASQGVEVCAVLLSQAAQDGVGVQLHHS